MSAVVAPNRLCLSLPSGLELDLARRQRGPESAVVFSAVLYRTARKPFPQRRQVAFCCGQRASVDPDPVADAAQVWIDSACFDIALHQVDQVKAWLAGAQA